MALFDDEERSSSDPDAKPATKADAKKDRKLQIVGVVVGLIAIIVAYVYYKRQQAANAANTTSATGTTGSGTVAGAPTSLGGGGSGGGGGGGNGSAILAAIQQEDTDITTALAGLAANQNTAGTTTNNYYTQPSSSSSSNSSGTTPGTPQGSGGVPFNFVRTYTPSSGSYSGKSLYALGNETQVKAARAAGYTVVAGSSVAGGNKSAKYALPKAS